MSKMQGNAKCKGEEDVTYLTVMKQITSTST
jgi:hypothetical protein